MSNKIQRLNDKKYFKEYKADSIRGKVFQIFLKLIVCPLARLIWIRQVEGMENIPKSGALIVAANHQSYLDFICLVSVFPRRLTFLSAEKFYDSRFWRPVMEYTGQIKVERNSIDKADSIMKALQVLERSDVLAIFPQGTRSRTGEIGKFYPGAARFALQTGAPVLPVGIKGAYDAWPAHQSRPKFKKMIGINIGRPLHFSRSQNLENKNVGQAADYIMREIARLADKKIQSG